MATANSPTGRFTLKNVRLAFPSLFEPSTFGEGEPSYQATLIVAGDDPQIATINKIIEAVAKEKWGAKADATLKSLRQQNKVALRHGDEKAQYDGFEGNYFLAPRSKTRPTVVDQLRQPIVERDGRIYAGCYVNALLEFWAQDNGYGKRVNVTLRGIQFVRDGEAFGGGRPAAADEFDELEVDDLV